MTVESTRGDALAARPDLTGVPADVVAYIEILEEEVRSARQSRASARRRTDDDEAAEEFFEAPTTIHVITISRGGRAKRTPRHLYGRQRRGGMGVFDLETGEQDHPAFLLLADVAAHLTVVTNQGRAFRAPVADLPETPVHSRGAPLLERFTLREDEEPAVIFADPLPGTRSAYLALVTVRGQVRRIGNQYLGKSLQPGTVLYNVAEGGAPAAACWSSGADELFIVTARGMAIRFAERLVPVRGCLGMRVDPQDRVVAIAACAPDGGVFLLSDEGKGTIRLMSGFTANKSPGAGGKTAMKADTIVGAAAIDAAHMEANTDIFAVSQLGKIIRFSAGDIPPKEGAVQGVNCMNLRADVCVAAAAVVVDG
jgi:DNA gyrase subunit A